MSQAMRAPDELGTARWPGREELHGVVGNDGLYIRYGKSRSFTTPIQLLSADNDASPRQAARSETFSPHTTHRNLVFKTQDPYAAGSRPQGMMTALLLAAGTMSAMEGKRPRQKGGNGVA